MSAFGETVSGFIEGFKSFGHAITNIVNFVMLALVYFIGVGLTWLFAKIFGKQFLSVKKETRKKSYWVDEKVVKKKMQEYYRSF